MAAVDASDLSFSLKNKNMPFGWSFGGWNKLQWNSLRTQQLRQIEYQVNLPVSVLSVIYRNFLTIGYPFTPRWPYSAIPPWWQRDSCPVYWFHGRFYKMWETKCCYSQSTLASNLIFNSEKLISYIEAKLVSQTVSTNFSPLHHSFDFYSWESTVLDCFHGMKIPMSYDSFIITV